MMNMSLIAKQLLIAWRRCFDNMLSKQLQDFIKESVLLRIINRKQLKKEVYTMKKILCLLIAFTMILGAGMPEMVYAG